MNKVHKSNNKAGKAVIDQQELWTDKIKLLKPYNH
jgi:hypothetical protein